MGQSKYQYNLDLRTFYDVMAVLDSQVYKSEQVKQKLKSSIDEGVCIYIEGQTVDPLKDNVEGIIGDIDKYIESLNFLKTKLNEYHDNMANTFSIKDVNRAIYLDVLGLDKWLKALKNYFGINSDEVNAVINDSGTFQEFVYNTQKEIAAKEQLYNDGFISDMIQGDRAIELEFREEAQKYRDAKKRYEESSNIVRKKIKFEDELDEIIKNISKAKGINDIEDAFSIESIREVLAQIRDGNYKGVGDIKVDSYTVLSPEEKFGIPEGIPKNVSDDYLNALYAKEGFDPDDNDKTYLPEDIGDGMLTIGPGIAVPMTNPDDPNYDPYIALYKRINDNLPYDPPKYNVGDSISNDDLELVAKNIQHEYSSQIYTYLEGNLKLTQGEYDLLVASFYNTGQNTLYNLSDSELSTFCGKMKYAQQELIEYRINYENLDDDEAALQAKEVHDAYYDAIQYLYPWGSNGGMYDEGWKNRINDLIEEYIGV